ncbi:hypothetical protein HQ585_18980 [candidate division KSB1 bacterium]|nr:hypothetical protein [candidate division KSB1 bacterium]
MIRFKLMKIIVLSVLLTTCFTLISCNESLPLYEQPENSLAITRVLASQGLVEPGIPILYIVIEGMNQYEETYDDTVNVQGELRIWWERHPELSATLLLSNANFIPPTPIHGSRLTLDPNQTFAMKTVYYFFSDDGQYIVDLLDYSANDIRGDYQYAKPETFIMKVDLLVYKQIGMISSESTKIEVTGFRRVRGEL